MFGHILTNTTRIKKSKKLVDKVFNSGNLILGNEVLNFENEFSNYK